MQQHVQFLINIVGHTLVDSDNQLICFILSKLSLSINNGLHTSVNEFLFEQIQVLKLILFVDKVVLQGCNRSFHKQ